MPKTDGTPEATTKSEPSKGDTPPKDTGSTGAGDSGSQKPKGDAGSNQPGAGEHDLSKLPDSTQKYIKDLRGENAKYRNRSKTLEADLGERDNTLAGVKKAFGIEPNKKLTQEDFDTQQNNMATTQMRSAILENAIEYGVPKDSLDYFSYLVEKKADELKEGEELSEDTLTECAKQARTSMAGGSSKTSVSTGGTDDENQTTPNPNPGNGELGVDEFVGMGTIQKSELYGRNPDLYNRLTKEASAKRRLV